MQAPQLLTVQLASHSVDPLTLDSVNSQPSLSSAIDTRRFSLTNASTIKHSLAEVELSSPVECSKDNGDSASIAETTVARSIASPEPQEESSRYDHVLCDPFPITRFCPNSTSSYLRPGARFVGNQSSEKHEYEVIVELQNVNMAESFLCGYLSIRGLTDEYPTLTTYFEGEMIGTKYSFITKHPEWGATEKVDMQHWARFSPWRPYQRDAKKASFVLKNWTQKHHIWMRWKEYFLVPDHRVTDLATASFDGFYYICFNQISGHLIGTYYHHKSEKYQHLELKPAGDRGFMAGFEFR